MHLKRLPISVLVAWLLFTASICAQDNPMDDPDLQQLLKQAQEMQKSSGSQDARKKLAEMEAMANQLAAQQEQEEKEEKQKDYYVRERSFGSYQRSFQVPNDVDINKIEANFKNGVLTLNLPKSVEAQKTAKKIEVKAS